MKFRNLQQNLRSKLLERIRQQKLTALGLAVQTGFRQPHISNFLNGRRSLSLKAMDRVLEAQKLSVLDLIKPDDINKKASMLAPSEGEFENVLLVDAVHAAQEPVITREQTKGVLKFKKSFLRRLRAVEESPRNGWSRFVLFKVDAYEAMGMYPRLLPGATVLVDRHYNSLQPYQKQQPNIYAVRKDRGATVKYIEKAGPHLILRPHNQSYPLSLLTIEEGKTPADYIIGRVCHIATEI